MTKLRYDELYEIIENDLFHEITAMHHFTFRRLID